MCQCRGVFMNYRSRLPYHPAYQIENAINEGGGSLCYAISGLLCWFQVSPALSWQQRSVLACVTCGQSRDPVWFLAWHRLCTQQANGLRLLNLFKTLLSASTCSPCGMHVLLCVELLWILLLIRSNFITTFCSVRAEFTA